MSTPVLEQSMSVPTVPIWRLTVAQYHQMIDAGILTSEDPIELLEGLLVLKTTKKPRHSVVTQYLRDELGPLVSPGWVVNVQEPVSTSDSEPEPDIAVIRGTRQDYLDRHPVPADVALIIEVSDSTLQQDRTLKRRIYARAGIPFYWIFNLPEQQLEVYSDPAVEEADYRTRRVYRLEEEVPVMIAGEEIGQLSLKALLS